MPAVLLILGGALVLFGAIVLVRYSDRPGGTVRWLGFELSSKGAGLPLIALGIGCVILASRGAGDIWPFDRDIVADTTASPDDGEVTDPLAGETSADTIGCLSRIFGTVQSDRVFTVEVGMRELDLLSPPQPLELPFGLVLTENGERIGAMRVRRFAGPNSSSDLYKVETVVDDACRPVTQLSNSRGGNPLELINYDSIKMRFGEHDYDLRIGGENSIGVGHFRRLS